MERKRYLKKWVRVCLLIIIICGFFFSLLDITYILIKNKNKREFSLITSLIILLVFTRTIKKRKE